MNREKLGISSDLSREMRGVHRLVVSCEEKFSVRFDPKLWITEIAGLRPVSLRASETSYSSSPDGAVVTIHKV